ncbi:hypothetical protein Hdeb2414_s0519g00909461 [Helianthus debilis subsp. tardiflorus]
MRERAVEKGERRRRSRRWQWQRGGGACSPTKAPNECWKQLASHGFECSGFSPVDSVQSRYGFGSTKATGSKLIKDGQNQQLVRDSTRFNSVN